MNKYIITTEVNTKALKPQDILWDGSLFKNGIVGIAPGKLVPLLAFVPALPAAVIAPIALKKIQDQSVIRITSVEQLRNYKNCISDEWKTDVLYVEHPHRNNVLIEESLYKDYILREMVADISNYILDNIDVSKLVVGLIDSKSMNAKASIPIKTLNADATVDGSLSQDYYYTLNDSKATHPDGRSYTWISLFPDVITAVEHSSGKMEITRTISSDSAINLNVDKAGKGSFKRTKGYKFYIMYKK